MAGQWTYRCEYVCCGKCPSRCAHGPYWYRYRREGAKVKKEYVGKEDPRCSSGDGASSVKTEPREWWLDMLHKETASLDLAERLLGHPYPCNKEQCRKAYMRECLMHHPDRGGSKERMQAVNAAWSYMKAWWRW